MTTPPAMPNDGSDAVQEHPEQLPTQADPQEQDWKALYGERFERLPEQFVLAIKAGIVEFQGQEKFLRRREVLRDRKNRFYERGYQHIYANREGVYTQGVAGGVVPSAAGGDVQLPDYIDDYNIFQPYGRIIDSVLTQNPPGINWRALDGKSSYDTEAAVEAEKTKILFDRTNDAKEIQSQIVRMMRLSSRVIVWSRTEANAQEFGYNDDGSPKKMEVATVHGTLESKVPIMAKTFGDCKVIILFDDPDIDIAKTEYPDLPAEGDLAPVRRAKSFKGGVPGLGESEYERTARLGVLQGSRAMAQQGDTFTHLITRLNCFARPAFFSSEHFDDPVQEPTPGDTGELPSIGQRLKQIFRDGAHFVFVGETYCGAWPEAMDDALAMGFPYVGEGMFRLAIMDPIIPLQDRFNDSMNGAAQNFDTGWASLWLDADDQDYEAVVGQIAAPNAIRQLKNVKGGQKASDKLYREENAELPETFMAFLDLIQGPLAAFILATPPSLQGAQMPDQKTASGYAQARSQAMGQQAIFFAVIQKLMAQMYYQAALAASRNPDHPEEIVLPGAGGQNVTLRLSKLTKGKFGAYPDEDSSFPETIQQKRETLNGIFEMVLQSPELAQQILSSPENWKLFVTVMGFAELTIPEAMVRDRTQFVIEQLLDQSPIPNPEAYDAALQQHAAESIMAKVQGQPETPAPTPEQFFQPSIPVDPEMGYYEWEYEYCKEWFNGPDCRRQLAENNLKGVANVRLYALANKALIPPPPMPLPAAPPGGVKPTATHLPPPPTKPMAPQAATM